jgi:RHS repeat-associated protein
MDADFGYTHFYVNKTTGLDLAWFRAYDSEKGRWLSRDPKGEFTGPDLYAYVRNNSMNFVDPFGLDLGTTSAIVALEAEIALLEEAELITLPTVETPAGAALYLAELALLAKDYSELAILIKEEANAPLTCPRRSKSVTVGGPKV